MKPHNIIISIIKESKGVSLFLILSIIAHSSIFLINPTFSFTVGDKWEEQKTGFLMVELKDRTDEDGKKASLLQPGAIPRRDKIKDGIGSSGTGRYKKTALKQRVRQPKILKAEAPIQVQTKKEAHKDDSVLNKAGKDLEKAEAKKEAVNKPAEGLKDNARDDPSHDAAIAPSPPLEPNKGTETAIASLSEKEDHHPYQPVSSASPEQPAGPVKKTEVTKGDVNQTEPLTEPVGEDAARESIEEKVIEPLIQETNEPVKPETSPTADSKEVAQQDKTEEELKPALVNAAPLESDKDGRSESGIGAVKSEVPTADSPAVKSADVFEKIQKTADVKYANKGAETAIASLSENGDQHPDQPLSMASPEQLASPVKEEIVKGDVDKTEPLTEPVGEDAATEDIEEKVIEPLIQQTNEPVKPDTSPAADSKEVAQQEKTDEELKPALVNAAPPESDKGERSESGIGAVKSEVPTVDSPPMKSLEVIEKIQEVADVKDEKAESTIKIIEPKIEARVKKKIRPARLHKILEPKKDPMRLGIPVNRPKVKITAPAKKKVSDRVQDIGGRVEGNGITRVMLSVNGEVTTIPVKDDLFQWDGALKEGKNIISASVWDMDGYPATDRVTVEVLPVKNSFDISIDEPGGGGLESPVTTVKGRIGDRTVDTVRLILNGEFVEAAAEEGRFEKTVLLKESDNILEAEAINSVGLSARSSTVKFTVKSLITSDIQIELLWNDMDVELTPAIVKKERAQIESEKAVWREIGVTELMSATEGYRDKILTAGEANAGAYELGISGGKGTECTLIVTINSSKRRVFEKMLLEGEVWIAGRFLMPEGVFWDEDEWFSGKIEDKDFMTKYKSPEGITWKERKVE